MGNADSIPVVSQTKSLVQAIGGDTEGARRTQENFSRQCPVVSQTRSLVEASMGDVDAARETQKEFVQGASNFADKVPVVGHIKGGIHYACGDKEGGDKAMMHATRGLVFGVPAMIAYGIITGDAENDSVLAEPINDRIAKDFNGVSPSKWTQALNSEMAVACYELVKALNQRKNILGVNYLTWDDVVYVLRSCKYFNQDAGNTKHIEESLNWDDTNFFKFDGSPDVVRKRIIMTWVKDLMNKHGEQSTLDNSVILHDDNLSRLASIASQSGATVKDPITLVGASEKQRKKEIEISVIRFPKKWECKIKIYRIMIFSWFKCTRVLFGQHDESGIELEYDTFEFMPNATAIDKRCAEEAKAKMSQPNFFNF